MVMNDRTKGYDDIKFLTTPAGNFFNNNSLSLHCNVDKMQIGSRIDGFTNLSLSISLDKGRLTGIMDSLKGYGGTYTMGFDGFLHSDFPQIKVSSSASMMDLGSFLADMGKSGCTSGIFDFDLQYTVNGSRLAHAIDNGVLDINLKVQDVTLTSSKYILRLGEYCKTNGFDVDFSRIINAAGTFVYHQSGESGFIQQMNLSSDLVSINGYGRYTISGGIASTGELTMKKENEPVIQMPFIINGKIGEPVLVIKPKNQNKSDRFVLY
jgi:hypothetical protein